jgi:hypothetical protein
MWRSGLRYKPGVPRTGWRLRSEIDFEEPEANCDWCGRAIRYVNLMEHPNWPHGSVRVGRGCAMSMSGRRMRAVMDFLQGAPDLQHVWASVCWALVTMGFLAFLVGW